MQAQSASLSLTSFIFNVAGLAVLKG
jgi:hypothetical protein